MRGKDELHVDIINIDIQCTEMVLFDKAGFPKIYIS